MSVQRQIIDNVGTAKSQLILGKGASAVGLTASVHKDPLTKEWTLEGGALVLADRGVCLIDEFDKMNEVDRVSIHEAMEQQSISLSKAGIVTSLQARCAVIAAANPIGGRYDPSFTIAENVELTDPILQRFDCICVLQDIVDPIADERLASFVVRSHMCSRPSGMTEATQIPTDGNTMTDVIPIDLLRKYIMYARSAVSPKLEHVDLDKVSSLYADLRKQSEASGGARKDIRPRAHRSLHAGVPIAVRHVESIIRMAEAHARMHLRATVRDDDIDAAIRVMLESFLQSQKVSVRRILQKAFQKYISHAEETSMVLMHMLQRLMRDSEMYQTMRYGKVRDSVEVFLDELEHKARALEIHNLEPFFASELFKSHNLSVNRQRNVIVKKF